LKDLETRAASESRRALNAKRFFVVVLVVVIYVLSDSSIILRKCTPGWRSCMYGFFLPHLSELLYLLGIPHLHESRPIVASSSVLLGV